MVQRCLHRLARPWYRPQALRVFRDQTSLAANPNLWASIEDGLAKSHYFILLACPDSARSEWIRREVVYWQQHRDQDTFLLALTEGEIQWDADAGDFDWARTDALPEQLRGWFHTEPLWVDLRWARERPPLSPKEPRFRSEVATLAAAVHGVPKDRLDNEDLRQRRRTRTALAFLGVLLLVLSSGLGYAVHLRNRAVDLQNRQREITVAGELRSRAEALRDTQPQTALRLDLAGYAINPSPQARAGLVTTLARTHYAGATAAPKDEYGMHDLYLDQVRFGADGHLAAGIGDDNRVLLWDVTQPDHAVRLPDLTGHSRYLNDVAISDDGRTVAVANRDDTVSLWDITDRARPRAITLLTRATGEKYGVAGVAFSHDDATLAAVGDNDQAGGTVALWNVTDLAHPALLTDRHGVYDSESVAFSPDDRLLVSTSGKITASSDQPTPEAITHHTGATLWDVADRAHPTNLVRLPVWSAGITFSPNGRLLALGRSNAAVLWDVTEPAHPRSVASLAGHTDIVEAIAFSPDGRTVATGSMDNTAILWDITDPGHPARLATLANNMNTVSAVRFTGDGRRVVTVDAYGTVAHWRVASPAQVTRLATMPTQTGPAPAPTVAVSPDGRTAASADGFAGTATVWDVANPAQPTRLATLTPGAATLLAVAFSPDGRTLATGDTSGRIVLWDMASRAGPHRAATITAPTQVKAVVFDPHRAVLVASGSANEFAPTWVTLWDLRDGTRPVRLTSFSNTGLFDGAPAFSPDGRTLVLTGDVTDRNSFWDVRNPSAPARIPFNITGFGVLGSVSSQPAFGPDGHTLASTSSDTAILWDVTDPSRTRKLATLPGHTEIVNRAVFAPGGGLLATAGTDHTTILWDVADPAQPVQIATLTGHTDNVTDVAFSPDGRWLATASSDDTIMIWTLGDLPATVAADPISTACHVAGGGLTPDQWKQYAPNASYRNSCP